MTIVARAIRMMPPSWIEYASELGVKHPIVAGWLRRAGTSMHGRDQVIVRGFARGLKINIGFSHVGYVLGTTEPAVQAALDYLLRAGMTVYDVGANVGFHALGAARRVGVEGCVICFEPLPENAKKIQYNAAVNALANIKIVTTALGSSAGEAAFWTSEKPTWGKLASVGKKPDRFANEVKVKIERLDALVDELNLAPPDLIKMDVEGAELDALEGARRTLERYRPTMLIEAHGTNTAIETFLVAIGYRVGVLGKPIAVAESYWNAHIFAIAPERADANEIFDRLRTIQG
ncbi:MAG: FkbM family methyltransferase [Candidatus Binatus sp.]|uniref:FkbM family methyltransferase n=1 Tax=Candidatus Binatus sp. TaxID=2811406 RepID=UPI00271D24D5|nr:FkbM family methyltransferase [Candidatus Binatus sp.]MDO8431589.1 FkbM family methyltransferase [Candidatus Binatus sp.]